jgi:predicted phage-related endonuclease
MNAPLAIEFPEVDRTSEVSAFGEHAIWTGICDSDRGSWLRARAKIITASRVPALLGLSPREDAIDVYADALRPANDYIDIDYGLNDPRTWGSALEEAIAKRAAKHYGWNLRMSGALLVSRDHPHIGCTQDAELEETPASGIWSSYEGKTTSNFKARDWSEDDERVPEHVIVQTQTQLLVTGAQKSIVSCLIGGQRFVRVDFVPDPDFFSLIIDSVDEMIDRISRMDPPPPTWRSKSALKKLFPDEDGESIILPSECVEYTRELEELLPRKKELELREETIRNLLRAAMGKASVGLLLEDVGGKSQWTNHTVNRAGFSVNPTSFRVLRLSGGTKKKGKK